MLDEVMGAYGSRFLLAAGGVGIALLVLIGVLWLLRNRAPSPFVRGGKNRQPRLQVLDAAAVDARRRLVLVRRDDVEHLIMIGGPSDIVIESRILPETAEDRQTDFAPSPAPIAVPAARPEAAVERPVPRPAPVQEFRPEPKPEPKPEPVAIFEEEEAEPEIYTPAPAPPIEPRPQPVAPISVSPAPVTPPPSAPPVQPSFAAPVSQPVAPSAERPIPTQILPRPVERPPVAPLIEASNAADILDAARARVLPQQARVEPQIFSPPAQSMPATPVPTADAGVAPQAPRGDFQRILEEEMNTNLMAERVVPVQNAPVRTIPQQPGNLPRRDPELPPITGADAELQKEVARIFGEMSVNRDK